MALMHARYPHGEPIEKAVNLVMSRQLSVRSGFVVGVSNVLISRYRMDPGHKKRLRECITKMA